MHHDSTADAVAIGAQFYDLNERERITSRITGIMDSLVSTTTPQVILDVGAGTGLPTTLMAARWPDAAIHAVEPSRSMRIALVTKLAASPELRRRVTVHPQPVERVELRGCVDLVTAFWSLGMIEPSQWDAAFDAMVAALRPDGMLLTESTLHAMDTQTDKVQEYSGETTLGEHRIEYGGRVERHDDGGGRGLFTYRWLDGDGRVLYEDADVYDYPATRSSRDVAAALRSRGMVEEKTIADPADPRSTLTLWRADSSAPRRSAAS